jgi:hypothetical protein
MDNYPNGGWIVGRHGHLLIATTRTPFDADIASRQVEGLCLKVDQCAVGSAVNRRRGDASS